MSSLPQDQGELSIEEILAQIRRQAAANPLVPSQAQPLAGHETSRAGQAGQVSATGVQVPVTAAATDVVSRLGACQSGTAAAAEADRDDVNALITSDGLDVDLPSVLTRTATREQPANVHPFRRPASARLGDALRRARLLAPSNDTEPVVQPIAAAGPPAAGTALAVTTLPEAPSTPTVPGEVAPSTANSETAQAALESGGEVKREMTSFLDTRFKKLGKPETSRAPDAPAPGGALSAATPPVDALPALSGSGAVSGTLVPAVGVAQLQPVGDEDKAAALQNLLDQLSAIGVLDRGARAPQNIADDASELLKPMLQQWLLDNMPRIVEKALHLEMTETQMKSIAKKHL